MSSLGNASPMQDGEVAQRQRYDECRSRCQKYCSLSFIAIYLLAFFSLSSNPEVVLVKSGYQYDVHSPAATVSSPSSGSLSSSSTIASQTNRTKQSASEKRSQHIQMAASKLARIYTPVSSSSWCIDGRLKFEQAKGRPMGLCYVKIPRAASSTLAGINVRIARNYAKRAGLRETCIRHDGPSPGFYYRHREASLSYLWTFVRGKPLTKKKRLNVC